MLELQNPVIDVLKNSERYICEPDMVDLGNGELVAILAGCQERIHKDEDDILLVRSHDGGHSWDADSVTTVWAASGGMGACNPGISRLSDGTLIIHTLMNAFWGKRGIHDPGPKAHVHSPLRDALGTWCFRSDDNGQTWSEPYRIGCAPMHWCQPADGITELPSGRLLMPVSGMRSHSWTDAHHEDPFRCFLLASDDRGHSWEYFSTIAYDPALIIDFHEPGMCRHQDGRLICLMRTHHGVAKRHGHLWLSISENDGESWSRPEATELWGYPADLTPLADGRILATYGHRRDPWSVRGCISEDGSSWTKDRIFHIGSGGRGDRSLGGINIHTGYPASVQLADGDIVSIWHEWSDEETPVQYVRSKRFSLP